MTPPVEHDSEYQVVIKRPSTKEEKYVPTLLTAKDNTNPRLVNTQPLDYMNSLTLIFDENVTASGFTVMCKLLDYSNDRFVKHR